MSNSRIQDLNRKDNKTFLRLSNSFANQIQLNRKKNNDYMICFQKSRPVDETFWKNSSRLSFARRGGKTKTNKNESSNPQTIFLTGLSAVLRNIIKLMLLIIILLLLCKSIRLGNSYSESEAHAVDSVRSELFENLVSGNGYSERFLWHFCDSETGYDRKSCSLQQLL